jgi:hypothetical protein
LSGTVGGVWPGRLPFERQAQIRQHEPNFVEVSSFCSEDVMKPRGQLELENRPQH